MEQPEDNRVNMYDIGPTSRSDQWVCEIYPKTPGLTQLILDGPPPNWFHRKMQEIVFGVKWIRP